MANFKIEEKIGEISVKNSAGIIWHKELNLVSWFGRPPKYEIRSWNYSGTEHKASGIVFTYTEGRRLLELLKADTAKRESLSDSLNHKVLVAYPKPDTKSIYAYMVESIGVFSERSDGVRKELNLMCWDTHEVKYDLRKWKTNDNPYFRRGVRLTLEEAKILIHLLEKIKIKEDTKRIVGWPSDCLYYLSGKGKCGMTNKVCIARIGCPNFRNIETAKPLPKKPEAPQPVDVDGFFIGQEINHPKFGEGKIKAIRSDAIVILFNNRGEHVIGREFCKNIVSLADNKRR